ncbi:MAG: hypothetical protein AAGE59_23965 [Cyanobacteria bacterium P01_F01_bin.86]
MESQRSQPICESTRLRILPKELLGYLLSACVAACRLKSAAIEISRPQWIPQICPKGAVKSGETILG